jgi:fermentation-respiration switch protein FrsA (DUF1100 family)
MAIPDLSAVARKFLYYPDRLPPDLPPPHWAGKAKEVWMRCEDGVDIHGLWWDEPEDGPAVLFLHGNAQEVYSWSLVHRELAPLGCRLLLIDYHGYGKRGGEPHEAGLYLDARAALKWLGDQGLEDGEIIVFGKSLGGGVACEIAQDRPFKALILESTFTSLAGVAMNLFPFLPPGVNLGESYHSLSKLQRVRCPVMVIHGDEDELIPVREGLTLYETAPEPKELYLVKGAGHNDVSMVAGPDYARRIATFLTSHGTIP